MKNEANKMFFFFALNTQQPAESRMPERGLD